MICDLAAYRDRCFLPCHGLSEVGLTVCLMCSSFGSVYGLVGLLLRAIRLKICVHGDPSDKNDQTRSTDTCLDRCMGWFSHTASKNGQGPRSAWIGICGHHWVLNSLRSGRFAPREAHKTPSLSTTVSISHASKYSTTVCQHFKNRVLPVGRTKSRDPVNWNSAYRQPALISV